SRDRWRVLPCVLLAPQRRTVHRRIGVARVAPVVVLHSAVYAGIPAVDAPAELPHDLVIPFRGLARKSPVPVRDRVVPGDGRGAFRGAVQARRLLAAGIPRSGDCTGLRRRTVAGLARKPPLGDGREVDFPNRTGRRIGPVAGDVVRGGTRRS